MPFCLVHRGLSRQQRVIGGRNDSNNTLPPPPMTTTTAATAAATAATNDNNNNNDDNADNDVGNNSSSIIDNDDDDDDETQYGALVQPKALILAMNLFTLGLFVLNILVYFNVLGDKELAGLAGWSTVVQQTTATLASDLDDTNDTDANSYAHDTYTNTTTYDDTDPDSLLLSTTIIISSLIPMLLVCCFCLYFSCLLWRYGCEFAMTIYTSCLTVWMAPFFGALVMFLTQFFGPELFLVMSNGGILYYIISMTGVLYEIRYDIRKSSDLGHFLHALEDAHVKNQIHTATTANNDFIYTNGAATTTTTDTAAAAAITNISRSSATKNNDGYTISSTLSQQYTRTAVNNNDGDNDSNNKSISRSTLQCVGTSTTTATVAVGDSSSVGVDGVSRSISLGQDDISLSSPVVGDTSGVDKDNGDVCDDKQLNTIRMLDGISSNSHDEEEQASVEL